MTCKIPNLFSFIFHKKVQIFVFEKTFNLQKAKTFISYSNSLLQESNVCSTSKLLRTLFILKSEVGKKNKIISLGWY